MIVEVSEKIGPLKIEPYEKIVRLNMGDFLLLSGLKNHREHRGHREKRHSSVLSVYSVVDQLCSDSFFQNKLINRLNTEGSETVTKCNRLKMESADGKQYLTDVADTETLLRLIQSVPSPRAEPIKLWLAKVGYERMKEIEDTTWESVVTNLATTAIDSKTYLDTTPLNKDMLTGRIRINPILTEPQEVGA